MSGAPQSCAPIHGPGETDGRLFPTSPIFAKGMRVIVRPDAPTSATVGLARTGVVLGMSGGYLAIQLSNGMVVSAQADEWQME